MVNLMFWPELNSVVTISSATISTLPYGSSGQRSSCTTHACSCQEKCKHQYECKYSKEGIGEYNPNLQPI